MSAAVPQVTHESMYGSPVVEKNDKLERARAHVAVERAKASEHRAAIDARDDAVRDYYVSARGTASDNELARRVDLNPSTFRSIIQRAPRAR